ncbi:MAG TPA: amidohydrolase family protein, partial [Polyangiaceae bacterium]
GTEVLDKVGAPDKILLKGMIVTPDLAFAGEVLVVGDTITCVAASCAADPNAAAASVVTTNGVILPGLIDTHNHILFDVFDEADWAPTQSYTNHNQWPNDPRYHAMVDAKQYLNGEGSSPVDFNCELDKYGELKGLIAGTTSIAGSATPPSNKACYGSLARTADQSPNGLATDKVQVATLFPSKATADGVCTNFASGKTAAYLIHIAEGVDASALSEFGKLGTISTTPGCLYAPKTSIVHGTALGDPELTIMATNSMDLIWSPQSNVFLYGAGTDLTKTTDVKLAIAKGINVSIAPDWSIGGSQNMLDELRFADKVDNAVFGDILTPQTLVQMATTHPAKALGLDAVIGSIAVGKKADLLVIDGDPLAPFDAVLVATPREVRLVMVGGVPLYGDLALKALGPASPGCEEVGVCTRCKFMCVATTGGLPTDKLAQTYADMEAALSKGMSDYDALNLTQWDFAPIAPLIKCQ